MDLTSTASLILTEILWNILVWIPTVLISLVFIRVLLGIRPRELIVEIEDHQTAAIGAVFFWVSLGFSMLLSRTIADAPSQATASWGEAFSWFGIALLVSLIMFSLGLVAVFGSLARRRREPILAYIQRELRQEHNLALSFIMGALFIVPVIVAYHITL
ncbi:hypothetical protein [Deinococcus sp. QL22]|uniref:hypothetical protein n=1 Tax=Deinococcus sp. QL22 TaxID=2939437 RepID=UPI002016AFE1|nr:hypothetical protein [Deinococcus sp. QL22]UQN09552.1 hypothetical protein M1R55_25735 [Deinococcus sp. QL22]